MIFDFQGAKERKIANRMTNLEACTDEELEQKLARVLAYAAGETLNDAEVQEFHQLYEEILRRAVAVTAALLSGALAFRASDPDTRKEEVGECNDVAPIRNLALSLLGRNVTAVRQGTG